MIKLFPTIKNKNLNSYYFNKHNNENISQTTNPLIAYMDLYFDFKPKTKSSFGLGDLLNAAMSGYNNKTEEAETKTIEDSITETISETESVCITHQGIIISLKKKYLHTASSYSNAKKDENIQNNDINKFDIPFRINKQTYKKHLNKMYQQFIESSKEIETRLLAHLFKFYTIFSSAL